MSAIRDINAITEALILSYYVKSVLIVQVPAIFVNDGRKLFIKLETLQLVVPS